MIEITAIRFAGGNDHEHITDVQWRSAATYAGLIPVPALIAWLGANDGNQAVARAHARLLTSAYENSPGLAAPVA
jgi:predicted metalloprotease with PDZ domain